MTDSETMSTVTNVLRDPLGNIPIPVGIQDGLNRWAGHQGSLALLTLYVVIALPLLYFVGLATYRRNAFRNPDSSSIG